jgi:hypothetical protein
MSEFGFLETLGPRIVLALVGLFFLGMFIGGFYWEDYILPARSGPWVVHAPGKYLMMISFFIGSFIFLSAALFLLKFRRLYEILSLTAFALFVAGAFVFG